MLASCLYEGSVGHWRHHPRPHAFKYRLFMLYLDLEELGQVFNCHPLWSTNGPCIAGFRRKDHLGDPNTNLHDATRQLIHETTGKSTDGPIRLLTLPSYLGYRFNPVSFYFCFDRHSSTLDTVVAEVNNTPWGEQHCYVLTKNDGMQEGTHRNYQFNKDFHVSPFLDMNQEYRWRIKEPGEHLSISTENSENGRTMLTTTLTLQRRAITRSSLSSMLIRYPLITTSVIGAIYWQALKLRLKNIPFFVHPKKRVAETGESI